MVEDELNDVAHLFTRSLHEAEYERLQALASSRHADTLRDIHNSTDMLHLMDKTDALEKINKTSLPSGTGNNRLKKSPGTPSDGEESDHEWDGTNLGPLMLSPRKSARDLLANRILKRKTKAAAGLQHSQTSRTNISQLSQVVPEEPYDARSSHPTFPEQQMQMTVTSSRKSSSRLKSSEKSSSAAAKCLHSVRVSQKSNKKGIVDDNDDGDDNDDDDDDDLNINGTKVHTALKLRDTVQNHEKTCNLSTNQQPCLKSMRPAKSPNRKLSNSESGLSESEAHNSGSGRMSKLSSNNTVTVPLDPSSSRYDLLDDVINNNQIINKPVSTYKGKAFLELQKKRQANLEGT